MSCHSLFAQPAEKEEKEAIPKRGLIQFNYESLHLQNEKLFLVREVPNRSAEKELVQRTFTVDVHYVEEGVTKTKPQQVTRLVEAYPMKKTLRRVGPEFDLKNVAGEKVDLEKLISEMNSNTRRIVVIPDGQDDIPKYFKEFLNPKTIIARIPPPKQEVEWNSLSH